MSTNGWNVSSGFIRYGLARVDCDAGSPPAESVMSDSTILPLASQGRVKSSSVPTRTFPFLTPAARTEPSVGRPELCMNMSGCAVPPTPPPATRIGSNGDARRTRFWYGSRCTPLVAYPRMPPRPLTQAMPCASSSTSCE